MDKNQLQILANSLIKKYAMTQLTNGYKPCSIHVYDDAEEIYFIFVFDLNTQKVLINGLDHFILTPKKAIT